MSPKKGTTGRVLEYCRTRRLFNGKQRLLVAVSGGADSMVLLDCMAMHRSGLGISLVVGHVDHCIRASSAEDAAFVMEHAATYGFQSVSRKVDVRKAAREEGLSLEAAGRRMRYAALKEMARETCADVIATGHTATDQAETVLMRMVRGTGPLGLAGIDPLQNDFMARPLLCVTRDEVRTHARTTSIPFRNDPSNRDMRFLRNRIRLNLVPILLQMNPRLEFGLSGLADSSAKLQSFVHRIVDEMVRDDGPDVRVVTAEDIGSCDPALLPYVVQAAFHDVTRAPLGLSATHIDSVVRLIDTRGGPREYHLPRGVTVFRDRKGLRFVKGEPRRR